MAIIKEYKVGKTDITFVWKYRYSKDKDQRDMMFEWRDWMISIWFRKSKIVGKKDFKNPNKWKDNLINSYMIGMDFLIIKTWIKWSSGGMSIEID